MTDEELLRSLGRIAEGAGLAVKNHRDRLEMIANLEYVQANVHHVLAKLAAS